MAGIPPFEVLLHRILWSFVLLIGVVSLLGRRTSLMSVLRSRRSVAPLCATTLLIAANWLVFIWAANSGRVLEISLGFFINPLMNVLLGMIFLRERLRRGQIVAVLLAFAGVANLTLVSGTLPWTALILATTFALYGLLRKANPVDPVIGLTVETGLLTPLAVIYLGLVEVGGRSAWSHADAATDGLLVLSGVVTAVPLLLYVVAAHRLRYVSLGLLQYISPTMHFFLAVVLYGEVLTTSHLLTFACIWSGLLLYVGDSWRSSRIELRNCEATS